MSIPAAGPTHGDFLTPAQSWPLRRCSLHVQAVAGAVGKTCEAAGKVSAGSTHCVVRRDCWDQSVSFVHLADPTVVMGVHNCCRGGG